MVVVDDLGEGQAEVEVDDAVAAEGVGEGDSGRLRGGGVVDAVDSGVVAAGQHNVGAGGGVEEREGEDGEGVASVG